MAQVAVLVVEDPLSLDVELPEVSDLVAWAERLALVRAIALSLNTEIGSLSPDKIAVLVENRSMVAALTWHSKLQVG